jgi:hypothetical protein
MVIFLSNMIYSNNISETRASIQKIQMYPQKKRRSIITLNFVLFIRIKKHFSKFVEYFNANIVPFCFVAGNRFGIYDIF